MKIIDFIKWRVEVLREKYSELKKQDILKLSPIEQLNRMMELVKIHAQQEMLLELLSLLSEGGLS